MSEPNPNPASPDSASTDEPWNKKEARFANLKGGGGGKNYSYTGGINSSFEGHLFGACDPHGPLRKAVILHEKPVHRLMQTMRSKGFSDKEIAEATGYTRNRVIDVLQQPWAQQNIVMDIKQSVQDEIKNFLEAEVMPTLVILKEIRDDPNAPVAVRRQTCADLLDRYMGKPNQPITTEKSDPTKLTIDELNSRVSGIVAGMATTNGNTSEP